MNMKQLEAFVKVADEGSFSKAARDLFLTQPTISAHISSLEKELNARLFVRNTKEVSLSEDGKILYQYARQIVELETQIEQVFGGKERTDGHCIRIAASTVPSQFLLPEALAKFREKYPKEQFKIIETDSAKVVEQIVDRSVDVGFTGTVLEKKHCKYIPFFKDELMIITPNNEKFQKRKETEEDTSWIAGEPLILRETGSGTRKEAEKQLKKKGITPENLNVVASMDNQETIKRSVTSGMGVSIISALAAKDEIADGKMLGFRLNMENGQRDINIVYNKNYQLSSVAENFIKVVKSVYKA